MELVRLKNWNFLVIGEIKSPHWSWMVATQVTYIYFGLDFWENLKKERASYLSHGDTTLSDQSKYNTQCYNDPTIQHFTHQS